MAKDTNLRPIMLDTNPEGLTVKERMFLKKLDKIIFLLETIYGKMCGENSPNREIDNFFKSRERNPFPNEKLDDDDVPF